MTAMVLATAVLTCLAVVSPARAQDFGPAREALRQSLRDIEFAGAFSGLVLAADELELAGARYRLDDSVRTRLTTFAVPFHSRLTPWSPRPLGLHLEGVFGRARASQEVEDLYEGALPEVRTAVEADWTALGGLLGVGPAWEPASGLVLAPLLNAGVSRISSDARYDGPGAAFTRELADGIAFNWDAWTLTWGGALRGDWRHALGSRHEARVVGRYDLRWTRPVDTDDPAQRFTSRLQLVTIRGDLAGPTGLAPFGWAVGWRAVGGYRHFLEGNVFDVRDLVHLGGSLEVFPGDRVPLLAKVTVGGAVVLGGALDGWSVGLGVGF